MPWKQLIATPYESELSAQFLFSGTIPYLIVTDNNYKILEKKTGTTSEQELIKLINKF